jgi:hypothetical protein
LLRKTVRTFVVTFSILGGLLAAPNPAAAAAIDPAAEKFVVRTYRDFLLRDPTTNERLWWSTALTGGTSRTQFVRNVTDSAEFRSNIAEAVFVRYLDRGPTDEESFTAVQQMAGSGDLVTAEADLLGGTEYFVSSGSTAEGFVESLYEDVLVREADPAGLSYWATRVASGTSRASIARSLLRSDEVSVDRVAGLDFGARPCLDTVYGGPDSLLAGSYCLVLDRSADLAGLGFWKTRLATNGQLIELWAALAASSEYFAMAQEA